MQYLRLILLLFIVGVPAQVSAVVSFTAEELDYLRSHPTFNICDRYAHFPLTGSVKGRLTGISGDIFRLIGKDLGVSFRVISADSAEAFVENVTTNQCDLIPVIKQGYEGFANIRTTASTEVYQHFVAVGAADIPYIEELEDLTGNTFYVKELVHFQLMRQNYPTLNVIIETDVAKIFEMLAKNHHSFFVLPNIIADYQIQEYGAHNFKVVDRLEGLVGNSAIGVNIVNAAPMLSILDKALQRIGEAMLREIADQYRLKEYQVISYAWLWYIVYIAMFLILLLLYRNNRQTRQNFNKLNEMHQLLNLTESMNRSGSWSYEMQAGIHAISSHARKLFCFSEDEIVSMDDWLAKVVDEDRQALADIFDRALNRQDINETIYRINGHGDQVRYIHDQWNYYFDDNARVERIVGIITDITDKVLNERKSREQEAMLLHQNRLAQQGEMLQMIGHQWRQPLAALSINIQLVKKQLGKLGTVPALVDEQFDKMNDSLQYLSRTITDFKSFFSDSKEKQVFKLADLFDDVFNISFARLEKFSIKIDKHYEAVADQSITTLKSELSQALLAIVNNAIDALQARESDGERVITVTIGTEQTSNLVIQIEDNAGGIPDDIIGHIFDPYFTTKKELNGTGLGLYMAKMIVEKSLSGSIVVNNSDRGAVFRISLPADSDAGLTSSKNNHT